MSCTSIENITKLIAFCTGIVFSTILLIFAIIMIIRDPTTQLWLSIVVGIVNLFLPSPVQFLSLIPTTQSTSTSLTTATQNNNNQTALQQLNNIS